MAPTAPQEVSMRQKLMALCALASTGTLVGIFSKFSQVSGRYNFSPASAVVCTEFFKLLISLVIISRLLMKRALVERKATSAVPPATKTLNNSNTNNAEKDVLLVVVTDKSDKDGDDDEDRHHRHSAPPASSFTLIDDLKEFWRINFSVPLMFHQFGLAAAYSIVNIVTYAIFIHASGSMFFLLKASSPVVTAILLFVMVNRRISKPQWIAVILQCVGLLGTQLNPCGAGHGVAVSVTGYILILINVVVSCAAGVWNEHIIKNFGTSVNFQNAFLYTFGVMINLLLFFFAPPRLIGSSSEKQLTFFEGYNLSVFCVILANSSVGLVITMVYKYADVVVKTFGLAGSTMTLFILEILGIIPGGRMMPLSTTLSGAAAVFYASYIYILPAKEFETVVTVAANNSNNSNSPSQQDGGGGDGGGGGGSPQTPAAAASFDVMALTWKAAFSNRRIKILLSIGFSVLFLFSTARVACQLGMN